MEKDGTGTGPVIVRSMLKADPWQQPNRYMENSPIFSLNRVQTPLLILHGAADTTIPSFLADEVYVGLRSLGKTVEYAKYDGEEHSPEYWSYPNQVDYC